MPTLTSIPPPSVGHWGWVRDELKSKADEKWVNSELKALRRMFDDTKVTAVDAKKEAGRPYVCLKEVEIEKMKEWQYKATNWKIPIIVSLLVLIVGAVGQYFTLKDSVEDGNHDRILIQKTLEKIEKKQSETSRVVEEMKITEKQKERERQEEMSALFQRLVTEMKTETKTRRRKKD